MGWWSMGEEDEGNEQAQETSPRRAPAGGRGLSAGRGRGPGRGRALPPRPATDAPEDSPSLFTSIGRMVSNTVGGMDDDTSTVGTAKYPGQNQAVAGGRGHADEAQRRANEMANAMSWLTSPAAAAAEPAPAPGSGLFTGADNWWEQDDAVEVDAGVSVFSGGNDFKTEAMPVLMLSLSHI